MKIDDARHQLVGHRTCWAACADWGRRPGFSDHAAIQAVAIMIMMRLIMIMMIMMITMIM